MIFPEISYEHKSEGVISNPLEANAAQRPVQVYALSNGKVRKLAYRMVLEILERFRSGEHPERAEIALEEGIRLFVRILNGAAIAEAIKDVISERDAVGMAAFLANLGATDHEASEAARRVVLDSYKEFGDPIIRSGARDGLDSLDEWAERRARRNRVPDRSISA